MGQRILGALLGALRTVLLVAALVVALLPIARSVTVGFCPPGEEAVATVAAPAGAILASVATEDEAGTGTTDAPSSTDGGPVDGSDGAGEEAGPCGPGVDRCLPPLISAVASLGSATGCGGEALAIVRGSMLPAFGIAVALLAGAWLLRPTHGRGVLSRW